jgi:hypothetical protein
MSLGMESIRVSQCHALNATVLINLSLLRSKLITPKETFIAYKTE